MIAQIHMDLRQRTPGTTDGVKRLPPALGEPALVLEPLGKHAFQRMRPPGPDDADAKRPERQQDALINPAICNAPTFWTAASPITSDAVHPGYSRHHAHTPRGPTRP